ncbi:hypothetical protein [Peptoclostridium acidaminophilum]|uniref:hypothetical protein n=1 Tax=Peptoclostridium acidaminophilum TaxID=1731 RepID=UPI00046D09A0|nr:hypothetical protein [Peptoclostridium acidaminophilum]
MSQDHNYDNYVEIYNKQGRQAAQEYVINECGLDYPAFQRKMRNESMYTFNRSTKKFGLKSEETHFMSLEELCGAKPSTSKVENQALSRNSEFDNLIIELIRDRITELHRFIRLDKSSNQIFVYSKAIKDNGYSLSVL